MGNGALKPMLTLGLLLLVGIDRPSLGALDGRWGGRMIGAGADIGVDMAED